MFTRKEHSFFNDPYFKIVREEQQYIEVQSVSTGHCWNVFKNQFEPTCKVKLYHKHKMTDQYYHEHRQCRTVAEAVKEIKEHDEYVLEQAKLKKERVLNAPVKKTRHLKVYETSGYKYKPKDYTSLADEIDRIREKKKRLLVAKAETAGYKKKIEELKDFINESANELTDYDESLVRKYIKEIRIFDDRFQVFFKAGVDVEIAR